MVQSTRPWPPIKQKPEAKSVGEAQSVKLWMHLLNMLNLMNQINFLEFHKMLDYKLTYAEVFTLPAKVQKKQQANYLTNQELKQTKFNKFCKCVC